MIELFANGLKFSYWTSASVTRSVGNIAAGFNVSLTGLDSNQNRVKLFAGDVVEIRVNDTLVIKGFVERVAPSFGSGGSSVQVSGYESTCDIADCCVTNPMEWDNKNMAQIITDICSPFGLSFKNLQGVPLGAAFDKFAVDVGCKAVDAVSKLCKERGILPCSNGLGVVYLLDPTKGRRGPELVEGVNILSANAEYTSGNRYSEYRVYGSGKAKDKVEACREDSDIERYRPLIIVDVNATEKDKVEARAEWECSIRKSKSAGFKVSVKGWESEPGKLWEPGMIVSLQAPGIWVDEPLDLLVSSVNLSWSGSGEVTNLSLVSPDSFVPQPISEKKQTPKNKTGRADPWASIRKTVKGK